MRTIRKIQKLKMFSPEKRTKLAYFTQCKQNVNEDFIPIRMSKILL